MNATIVILGGGPAGLSCALWLKHLGFSPIIVEKQTRLGGLQQLSYFHNSWYLGLMGKTGREIAEQLEEHITLEDIPTICGDRPQKIIQHGDGFQIFTDTQAIIAHSLVIATGQSVIGYDAIADIEGSSQLLSSENVCFDPGKTPLLSSHINGGTVAVIGGGDNGMGTVRYLEHAARHIHLLVRSELRGFAVNKQKMSEMAAEDSLKIHQPITLRQFEQRGEQIQIVFQDENHRDAELLCDYLCFRLGFTPNVEDIVRQLETGGVGSLKLLPSGHIATDGFCRTSIKNIYVAGDVANPRDPCVATAVAQGTMAARSLEEDWQHRS